MLIVLVYKHILITIHILFIFISEDILKEGLLSIWWKHIMLYTILKLNILKVSVDVDSHVYYFKLLSY